MRVGVLILAFWLSPVWADAPVFTAAEEARYQGLINQLRCLVCQNQTIAESNAPLAQDLRRQVQEMMQAGHSDTEIMRYLTERYGDFVLYRPPIKRTTWLLWAGPFALLALALLTAFLIIRNSRKSRSAPVADAEVLRRILEDRDA
jgi:cytochrome c-type biogenesis protein CcmH